MKENEKQQPMAVHKYMIVAGSFTAPLNASVDVNISNIIKAINSAITKETLSQEHLKDIPESSNSL